jgi:hypothetical protein
MPRSIRERTAPGAPAFLFGTALRMRFPSPEANCLSAPDAG